MIRKCDNCGNEYEACRPTSKYCSHSCRVRKSQKNEKSKKVVAEAQLTTILNNVLEATAELKEFKEKMIYDLITYNQAKIPTAPNWNKGLPMERNDANLAKLNKEVEDYLGENKTPLQGYYDELDNCETSTEVNALINRVKTGKKLDWPEITAFNKKALVKISKLGY